MRAESLGWFATHLGLNAFWSLTFFELRAPGLSLVSIAALWLGIARWIVSLATLDRTSVALTIPYLAWVTFASTLNYRIWRLNRAPCPTRTSPC